MLFITSERNCANSPEVLWPLRLLDRLFQIIGHRGHTNFLVSAELSNLAGHIGPKGQHVPHTSQDLILHIIAVDIDEVELHFHFFRQKPFEALNATLGNPVQWDVSISIHDFFECRPAAKSRNIEKWRNFFKSQAREHSL